MSKLTLISSATASGSSSIDFTSGLQDYDEIIFYFVDIQHSNDDRLFEFQVSTDASGHTYGQTITSTFFEAHHYWSWATDTSLSYDTSRDLAQSTSYQKLSVSSDNGGTVTGAALSGEMHLFGCASSSKVKHFYARTGNIFYIEGVYDNFISGYVNQTTPLTAIRFRPDSNTFSGEIHMFGAS